MADAGVPTSRFRLAAAARFAWAVGTVLLVGAAGLLTRAVSRERWGDAPAALAGAAPATTPVRLEAGHDYYLHVKLIELTDHRPDGKTWDTGGSGPDMKFRLTWHKNVIWNSNEKPDTLIGSWDLLKVDVKQILTSGGQTDLDELVNAPLVHYERGETVELLVWDNDSVGSDDAGTLVLKLDELSPGENTLWPEWGKTMAVKRVVLALIDRKTPLPELVEMISKR